MRRMGEEGDVMDGSPLSSHRPTGNRVLDALDAEEAARLFPDLEPMRLAPGQILGQTGQGDPWALFPCGPAVVSVVAVCEDGRTAETLSVGSEGMLGPMIIGLPNLGLVRVQMPGQAWRLGGAALAALNAESRAWRDGVADAGRGGARHDNAAVTQPVGVR